jgi:XFP-like protein
MLDSWTQGNIVKEQIKNNREQDWKDCERRVPARCHAHDTGFRFARAARKDQSQSDVVTLFAAEAAHAALFTRQKPVIFAYHGYPYLIHRLTYDRSNHDGIHVRGFAEEGTTTTPFDMVVLGVAAAHVKQQFRDAVIAHSHYVREHGEDMPEIRDWVWPNSAAGTTPREAGD